MRFAIYSIILISIELIFLTISYFISNEISIYLTYYLSVASILLLIFFSKYLFLHLTRRIQAIKPHFWVNANLLAFAVKFVLIIGLMLLLTLFVKQGAKIMIIWTAILYSFLLSADILYDLKKTSKAS